MLNGKKSVVFVIYNITAKGGEERMCSIIANYLQEHGHRVSIISLVSHKGKESFFKINDDIRIVHILGLFIERRIRQYLPWLNYLTYKLRRCLKRVNPDIVIDVDVTLSPITSEVVAGLGIKHISWDHFPYGYYVDAMPKILSSLRTVDRVIVLTEGNKKCYTERSQIEPSKVIQIYNPSPIEIDSYTPHENKVVLAMGRLEFEKGFDRLLNIWVNVEPKMPDWTLKIIGSGGLEGNLKEQAIRLGLRHVIFQPHSSSPVEQYKEASIFVLPSRFEGFGLVLLEALNMSLPIVAFDCENGPREIIKDGVNGYLVSNGDELCFAEKLLQLMQNGQLRNKLGNNALLSASRFTLERVGQRWLDLVENL